MSLFSESSRSEHARLLGSLVSSIPIISGAVIFTAALTYAIAMHICVAKCLGSLGWASVSTAYIIRSAILSFALSTALVGLGGLAVVAIGGFGSSRTTHSHV